MAQRSEGVKRILFLLSVLSVIGWISFLGVKSDGFSTVKPIGLIGWLILVGTSVAAYLAPQLIGKLTYWVIDGFKKDNEQD